MGTEVRATLVPSFETHPSRYRHWRLQVQDNVATLTMDVQEQGGLRDDYLLKQNSYDLGVDLELADAIDRLRFEHPKVDVLVLTSAQPKVFCAGANIRMLASSTHAFKQNFCRFTNETRCGLEDASRHSGLRSLAALNGTAAGGGYELALACDRIVLIDDGNAAVSLPEVPLLGVLPGTGGLTRLVDKRGVRRDLADLFCTKAEGFRAREALRSGLVDATIPRSRWTTGLNQEITRLSQPREAAEGVELTPLKVQVSDEGRTRCYSAVLLQVDAEERVARLTIHAPTSAPARTADALRAQGDQAWSLRAFRELDDALLHLRFRFDQVGLILLRAVGQAQAVLDHDEALLSLRGHHFAREILLYQARVLRRMDNTARSTFAVIDRGTCFAGVLLELALSADRTYLLADDDGSVQVQVGAANRGPHPMSTGMTRIQARFPKNPQQAEAVAALTEPLAAEAASAAGLVTLAPDELDWEDELRIAIEERISLSPDALTGMEQNLRFVGSEGCDSKIFGRLSAWQNWIFQRPNAVGDEGALTLYGHPTRPRFDFRRT